MCDKTVYVLEKIECDGRVFHKTCFKCEHCKRTLSLGNFAGLQGKLYCKPHFKQVKATRRNITFVAHRRCVEPTGLTARL